MCSLKLMLLNIAKYHFVDIQKGLFIFPLLSLQVKIAMQRTANRLPI
jgi:hypothetical protein